MLAERIDLYLKEHGIRQTWLAEKLGIPNTTLNGIIKGRAKMKADMFISICKLLNVPPEQFTSEKQEKEA